MRLVILLLLNLLICLLEYHYTWLLQMATHAQALEEKNTCSAGVMECFLVRFLLLLTPAIHQSDFQNDA